METGPAAHPVSSRPASCRRCGFQLQCSSAGGGLQSERAFKPPPAQVNAVPGFRRRAPVHLNHYPTCKVLAGGGQDRRNVGVAGSGLGPEAAADRGPVVDVFAAALVRDLQAVVLDVDSGEAGPVFGDDPGRIDTGPGKVSGVGAELQDGLINAVQDEAGIVCGFYPCPDVRVQCGDAAFGGDDLAASAR